jgi:uncharacterized protein YbgA (DUF1722 family)/uncharacterized protein YbbK (DUF523 family)
MTDRPLRVGVSSCLLGEEVRYDGGHKRDAFLTDMLGAYVEWVPVCPEVESGMGIPRPAVRLELEGGELRVVDPKSRADHTSRLVRWSESRLREIEQLDLAGWILKKDSPSCGMERVKVWRKHAVPVRDGRGLFAGRLLERMPNLPVEEEGRLHDAALRENFVERLFAYRRLRDLLDGHWSVGDLVAFHTAHKLQLLSHSEPHYRKLGRLVAGAKSLARRDVATRYESGFMEALRSLATRRRQTNVLQHCAGYVRDGLDAAGRAELAALIDDYRRGFVPLVVPITLLRHHVRRLDVAYLAGQRYLEPHPKELMLRNHV